jgi:hypothetical protein
MTAKQCFDTKFGQLVPFTFEYVSIPMTNAANTDAYVFGTTQRTAVVPGDGSLVGITGIISGSAINATISTGSFVVHAHKDSVEFTESDAPAVTIVAGSGSALNSGYSSRDFTDANVVRLSAGDRIGISFTTTGCPMMSSGSPTLLATAWVMLD